MNIFWYCTNFRKWGFWNWHKEKNKTTSIKTKQNKTNKQAFEKTNEKRQKQTKQKQTNHTNKNKAKIKVWIGLQQLCKNMLTVSYNVSYAIQKNSFMDRLPVFFKSGKKIPHYSTTFSFEIITFKGTNCLKKDMWDRPCLI